ncbi:MAG: cupin domain-containing protein [Desulfarculaceae bacterium]|nr:cupin domain-containing protein [Desulfarculaceae bacterium]MCF8046122.1 cupin domain-containing protein [Desulfarculaceae bacterium]MCF8064231.1 cupin domain-containing protein [Desulfarculaceae bacterium]MCF8123236.1 cupin domain-containing protein [Desulfarculaceae bacterium]
MLHKNADELKVFTASDGCRLAEVIHPANDPVDAGISLSRAWLPPGEATKPHYLDFLEIYYVLRGRGVLHQDDLSQEVGPESCVYLPPGSRQWLENTGQQDLVFLCVCHPAWRAEGDHSA